MSNSDIELVSAVIRRHGWPGDDFSIIDALTELKHVGLFREDAAPAAPSRDDELKARQTLATNAIDSLAPSAFALYRQIRQEAARSAGLTAATELGADHRVLAIIRIPTGWEDAARTAWDAFALQGLAIDRGFKCAGGKAIPAQDPGAAAGWNSSPDRYVFDQLGKRHAAIVAEKGTEPSDLVVTAADFELDCEAIDSQNLVEAISRRFGWVQVNLPDLIMLNSAHVTPSLFDILVKRSATPKIAVDLIVQMIRTSLLAGRNKSRSTTSASTAGEQLGTTPALKVAGPNRLYVVRTLPTPPSSDHKAFVNGFKKLSEEPTPLRTASAFMLGLATDLAEEWPHASDLIATILRDLRVDKPIRLQPTLLVGSPGSGKTTLLRELCGGLGLPTAVYPCASVSDSSFGGTPAQWHSRRASVPLEQIRQHGVANPAVILDELEKTGHSSHNGSLVHSILPMLEGHTAREYFETAIETSVNLSGVVFLATANSLSIPDPLRDRFRVMRMPDPGPEHIGILSRRIIRDLERHQGLEEDWIAPLAQDEIDVVRKAWGGGSLRRLRRAIEATVDARDAWRTMQ